MSTTLSPAVTDEPHAARAVTDPLQGEPQPRTAVGASGTWLPGVRHLSFGGDYNPEQWPREVWLEDIRLMREAGVTLVSIGIFSWALLEPREGEFDFAWLDDVVALLADAGIGISLGTPTASPPAWFWAKYPAARPVTRDGVPLGFGSRGMASPSSPEYAIAVTRIVTELATRYGSNPAVKLWHVHNEYGAPVSDSYDDHSVRAFRAWLEARYVTIERLNAAWGTTFWGQHYAGWHEIDAPRRAATTVNPAQQLDFARFTNFALLECFKRERDILRRLSPGIPITTNFMATSCPSIDYWSWAREVDIVSNDHYLTSQRDDRHVMLSMDADMVRSLAGGKAWLLMEHSTSAVNWQSRNIAKQPGELARNSFAHYARGADGILFFQWRASRFGAEKFHSAMLPHGGSDSRIHRETAALGRGLARLDETLGSVVGARVAILWDWESLWALGLEWRPSADLNQRRQIETFYSCLWHDGFTIDFAHPEADLSAYDLVIAPSLYLVSDAAAENLRGYVARGGVFVSSYFSGIVGETDAIPAGFSPGQLRDVLGIEIEEFRPLRSDERVLLSNDLAGSVWTDDLRATTASVLATYVDGPAAGGAAITRNEFGDGTAWYFSTELDAAALSIAMAPVFERAGIHIDADGNRSLETVERVGADHTFTTYINHAATAATARGAGVDLLTGEQLDPITVPAGGVRVIRRENSTRPNNESETSHG
ncbi:MAG TPA: beta-galactosidase [Galbitalea sp.]|jgi:beta-galactosidase